MSRFGRSLFSRVLIAALIPFVLLFGAAWFALGRAGDGAGIVMDARTLWVAGGAVFALLVVCVFAVTRPVARSICRLAERADAVTGDGCDAVFDDVPIRDAAQEVALLRDALIRMSGACGSANKRTILLTELERARRIESADMRYNFFTILSSKVRTPLNAVIGIAGLLLKEPLEEGQAKNVAGIKSVAASLLSTVNDILDLSRMESGAFSLTNADYDVGETLRLIREQTMALIAGKPLVVFEMSVDESMPDCLCGDEARVRQMLMSLLRNAAKSTNRGFVRFHARAGERYLHFDISGSDFRIRQEDLPKRFDPACFLSSTGDDRLGLAIGRFLAVAMDGSIKVESGQGKGVIVRITVPRVDGNPDAAASQRRTDLFRAPKARVLVVDDEEANLNVSTGLLSLYEIPCDRAASGREAIELIRRNGYDLVFIDRSMPDMDGIQTTGIIRAQGGVFSELPIIAVTTSAADGTDDGFTASGFSDVLTKPIDMARLRALLLKWLPERVVVFTGGQEPEMEPTVYTSVLEAATEIWELDITFGLNRVGGEQDLYEHLLKMTLEKAHLMATALVAAASHGDFDSVRLHAHAAKGSLSDIGATRLAILAADIERAAEAGDMAFCRENMPSFINRLGQFVEALNEVFERVSASAQARGGDAFSPGIARIRAAIDSSDFEAALAASGDLAAEAEKSGRSEKLRLLRDALEHFDYDSAIALLDRMQGERLD